MDERKKELKWFYDEVIEPLLDLMPMDDYINADIEEGTVQDEKEWMDKFDAGLSSLRFFFEAPPHCLNCRCECEVYSICDGCDEYLCVGCFDEHTNDAECHDDNCDHHGSDETIDSD